MKKLLFLLVAATTLFATSCKDDESNSDFMRATIDGSAFDATSLLPSVDDSFGEDLLFITGRNDGGTFRIILGIPTSTPEGNVVIEADDLAILFADDSDNGFLTVGNINITNNDTTGKVMEGEFAFTATQDDDDSVVYEITGGEFSVSY